MISEQIQYTEKTGWRETEADNLDFFDLVIVFSAIEHIKNTNHYTYLENRYPNADIIIISTAGEIFSDTVSDDSMSVVAMGFERTKIKVIESTQLGESTSSDIGKDMASRLKDDDLKHILVFSEGLKINGTKLIEGLQSILGESVGLTGGLAGDGPNFSETYVSLNQTPVSKDNVVMVGLYGPNIEIGTGSIGGWDVFGQTRIVTKAQDNVVYELDNEPILDLYNKYLGELAKELPESGLLFPLNITPAGSDISFVRTLLAIDKGAKSVIFAGDIPEGAEAQLMKANFDRLIEGAGQAAVIGIEKMQSADVAILVSCVGRKLILKQRTEEELESISEILGKSTIMTGLYSYGEIGPSEHNILDCKLHNQTMTITLIKEK